MGSYPDEFPFGIMEVVDTGEVAEAVHLSAALVEVV